MTATVRVNHADVVLDALRAVLPSAVPALVFTSLAASCVPTFSDRCHVLLQEDGAGTYAIQRPLGGADADVRHRLGDAQPGQWVGAHTIRTTFDQTDGDGGYRGSVLQVWDNSYHPTDTDAALARLAVDHVVAILHRERGTAPTSPTPRTEAQQRTLTAARAAVRAKAAAAASMDSLAPQRQALAAYQDSRGRWA